MALGVTGDSLSRGAMPSLGDADRYPGDIFPWSPLWTSVRWRGRCAGLAVMFQLVL